MSFEYFCMIMVGIIGLAIAIYILKASVKSIFGFIGNLIIGILLIWFINTYSILGLYIPINIITIIVVGLFGGVGVLVLAGLKLFGIM